MEIIKNNKKVYQKHQSFETFISHLHTDIAQQKARVIAALQMAISGDAEEAKKEVWKKALLELNNPNIDQVMFKLTTSIADEISKIEDQHLARYIYHRYRYDVFPRQQILDKYPPYLQIEPASICNFRCVFCYQTDKTFTEKASGHMGTMTFDMFKTIIDQAVGNIEFFSLASRGEPLVCKDISKMLEYSTGKFLGMKMNTNASLLTEEKCHAILSGGINTLVFSADAAVEPLYSQLRVGGNLEKVLKNVTMFKNIKDTQYPKSKLITRVSGVKFNDLQSLELMDNVWGPLVDQVCFVQYNPWENVYDAPLSSVNKPCSDLWRRMFIWCDGKTNPCDTDYKSTLNMGKFPEKDISSLWSGEGYMELRQAHVENKRNLKEPCRRCTVV